MTTATGLRVWIDEDGNYNVLGPCTREQALDLMREYAVAVDDHDGPTAQSPADLDTGWVLNPVPGFPDGDVMYAPVPAGTPGALPVTTSLY
ncbi:hypothetical protein OG439_40620 [Amycolatopsis sp. NBC_01307]|uniref:hypothetical protein n=1 Tax=Amycolatopsis sp. NBC_01307 TaxID=2903561 RepID=UPI002E137691|nr:hypothetical protein OG439_40620 [Amycolatopsis sp. NBC_01307]